METSVHNRFEFVAHSAAIYQAETWARAGFSPRIRVKVSRDKRGNRYNTFIVERGDRH